MNGYEVGKAYTGCSDREDVVKHQREMLSLFLEHFGNDRRKWSKEPYIIKMCNHEATVGVADFGRKLYVNNESCRWAVHGVLAEAPPEGADWLLHDPRVTW